MLQDLLQLLCSQPSWESGSVATTEAGSGPSSPLPAPLGPQHPSDTCRTRIHRASNSSCCTTSQASCSSGQGPPLHISHISALGFTLRGQSVSSR